MEYLTEADYAIAEKNGISREIAYQRRYKYFWSIKRTITEPVGAYKPVTNNTKLWDEWKDVAEKNGISRAQFFGRMNTSGTKKWSAEEAATRPMGLKRNVKITPEIYELAKQHNIKTWTLRNRVFNLHWDVHRAATEPVGVINKLFVNI